MTRKHFNAIAEAIRISIPSRAEREAIAKALAPSFMAANPKFSINRFISAAVGE